MPSNDQVRQTVYLAGVITACIVTISSLILGGLMFFLSEDRSYIPTLFIIATELAPIIIMLKTLVSKDDVKSSQGDAEAAKDIPPTLTIKDLIVEKE